MQESDGDARYWLPPQENGKPLVLTAARKKRGDVVTVETDRGGVERRSLAAPLDFYVARGHVTGEQYRAGGRLHALWRGSILSARYATMRFGDGSGGEFDREAVALIPRDYFRAMDAVRGFREKRMIRLVCCFGEPAGRGNLDLLRAGLDDLVKHFRPPDRRS